MESTFGSSAVVLRVVLVGALCLTLAACQSGGGGVGVVTGVVTVVGGPTASPGLQTAQSDQPQAGQEVVIEDREHHRTTTTSDASGHYTLSLPPGDYTLMCSRMQPFTIVADQTVTLDCLLAV